MNKTKPRRNSTFTILSTRLKNNICNSNITIERYMFMATHGADKIVQFNIHKTCSRYAIEVDLRTYGTA